MTELRIDCLDTPVGPVSIAEHGGVLCALHFDPPESLGDPLQQRFPGARVREHADPCGFRSRLLDYFAGTHDAIDEIPVDTGGTPFQRQVWKALREIPCGETRSYRDIAEAIGHASATRAVGMANHRNPVGLVVPCHRVVAADGGLGGYASGPETKRWLLVHEGALLA